MAMTKDDRIELAATRELLLEAVRDISELLERNAPKSKKKEVQNVRHES